MRTEFVMPVGIDDLAIYVPKLYLDYKDFAEARGIDPQKLEYGIGVKRMDISTFISCTDLCLSKFGHWETEF